MAASVLFPLPLGPMMACTSPGLMTRSMPLRICLFSTPAWRSLISRRGCFIFKVGFQSTILSDEDQVRPALRARRAGYELLCCFLRLHKKFGISDKRFHAQPRLSGEDKQGQ